MPQTQPDAQELPWDMVGSSTYGRSPYVQASRTYNMIISDDFLVDFAGYKNRLVISDNQKGRGIFGNQKSNIVIVVEGDLVYKISILENVLNPEENIFLKETIGSLGTFSGDVFIDENNTGQIAICDQKDMYIYTPDTNDFQQVFFTAAFVPAYVTYQDGYFIAPNRIGNNWALSSPGNGLDWYWGASGELVAGQFQTAPDNPVAVVRAPGKGGLVYVMGSIVTELWSNQPTPRNFPYVRSSSSSISYGCASSATIAVSDDVIAWLAINSVSGPVIAYSKGTEVQFVSPDGLSYKFSELKHPEKSSAFFVKMSDHLIYMLTFYDPADNFSVIYDFKTGKIFDVTNEYQDHHIARRTIFFKNRYYFVSFEDGNLYELNDHLFTFDYGIGDNEPGLVFEIPRIRISSNIRTPKADIYCINFATFPIQQGEDDYNTGNDPTYDPRIGLSISKNGGITFSGYVTNPVYTLGKRKNKLNWWNLGLSNNLVAQVRFFGKGPFRAGNGVMSVYI